MCKLTGNYLSVGDYWRANGSVQRHDKTRGLRQSAKVHDLTIYKIIGPDPEGNFVLRLLSDEQREELLNA